VFIRVYLWFPFFFTPAPCLHGAFFAKLEAASLWRSWLPTPYNKRESPTFRRSISDFSRVQGNTAMPISMELSRIIISEVNDQQVIYLKEVEGDRTFPILIGIFEATSIDRRVKGFPSPRPLTHDLIVNVVENLGGEFQDVIINELKDHTYYARLRIRHNGELVEIDSRPSDAIAVAVTCDPPLPIYVNEDVLNDVLGEQ
jgi:bifunctional DNase/RNase